MNPVLWTARRYRPATLLVALLLVLLLGAIGYAAPDFSLAILYLIPIVLVAGPLGMRAALGVSVASSVMLFFVEQAGMRAQRQPLLPWWNGGAHFVFFAVTGSLLALLEREMQREERLARQDSTTGAANRRAFFEVLDAELERARRYGGTFVLAILDLDNFKAVNDAEGHAAGDELLRILVSVLRGQVRATDTVARLGGDEFAILLPHTDAQGAIPVFTKLRAAFEAAMTARRWPVSYSCGVLFCPTPPATAAEALRLADGLLYAAKHAGKHQTLAATIQEGSNTSVPVPIPLPSLAAQPR